MFISKILRFLPDFSKSHLYLLFIIICLIFTFNPLYAQVTGLTEDFNDNLLTGWVEGPPVFKLFKQDGTLKIVYARTATDYEWDNFNFTPPQLDVAAAPYIQLEAKSTIRTILAVKPVYSNGNSDWIEAELPADNAWHKYTFQMATFADGLLNQIYFYFDGGSKQAASGVVYFDNLRIGDQVETEIDLTLFQQAIQDAKALNQNSIEGGEEGQFPIGSKSALQAAIDQAEVFVNSPSTNQAAVNYALETLYDACTAFEIQAHVKKMPLVDSLATKETRNLFSNLLYLGHNYLLFGHQEDLAYGIGWQNEEGRSDVKSVCGAYPAVYGWDIGEIELGRPRSLGKLGFEGIRHWIRTGYSRGGIITITWHATNPVSGGNYLDLTPAVPSILPGGSLHEKYQVQLDRLAFFLKSLRAETGNAIPIIFRPLHEHNKDKTFWWCQDVCTIAEYQTLWQFIVHYLRDVKGLHHLLYAYSPYSYKNLNHYLERYPGDDYVDMLGLDDYEAFYGQNHNRALEMLRDIVILSAERNKIPALTEVGLNLSNATCWTTMLRAIKSDTIAQKIAYMLVWRNASASHFFGPYPGHGTAPDFVKFYDDPFTLFEINLPNVYQSGMDSQPPVFTQLPKTDFIATDTTFILYVETNENAFVRYSLADEPYEKMPFEFQAGQGTTKHSTTLKGEQGGHYTYYLRAMDVPGNITTTSTIISFKIDTMLAPIHWYDLYYNSRDWKKGAAPCGFGSDAQIKTQTLPAKTLYFRHIFQSSEVETITYLAAIAKYDNGIILYLNGQEAGRLNMPDGKVDFNTPAVDGSNGLKALRFEQNVIKLLRNGKNILAVELHQHSNDAADAFFDLRFISTKPIIEYGSTWEYFDGGFEPPVQTKGSVDISEEAAGKPFSFQLLQNFPNPFNSHTTISYQLSQDELIHIAIYNLAGQKIANLVNEKQKAGRYTVKWDGRNDAGQPVASGVYFCRFLSSSFSATKKLIFLQ